MTLTAEIDQGRNAGKEAEGVGNVNWRMDTIHFTSPSAVVSLNVVKLRKQNGPACRLQGLHFGSWPP